jgi:hypothetical protein
MSRSAIRALLLVLAAATAGCSSGGNGGGGMLTPEGCLGLQDAAAGASGTVVAAEDSTDCDDLVVELAVTGVDDLFGAQFTVNFNPTHVSLQGVSKTGSVLESGGATVTTPLLNEIAPGQVQVGFTRQASTGVDVPGTAPLAWLMFRRVASAGSSGSLSFTDPALFDSDTPPQEIASITWFGAELVIE